MISRSLALIGFILACSCKPERVEQAREAGSAKRQSEFSCEEHWMVSSVAADLETMLQGPGKQPVQSTRKVVEISPQHYSVGDTEVTLSPSAWDPSSYELILRDVEPEPELSSAPSILPALLEPNLATIQSLNLKLSDRLAGDSRSAALHQQAALLRGSWGLHEAAESLTDLRPLICRMTAHLAMADALRGDAARTRDGIWADILLDYHAGRRKGAHAKLEEIRTDDPVEIKWKRAMDAFIRGDWRVLDGAEELSLLEALAQFRALLVNVGEDRAMTFLESHEVLHGEPDWSRLFLEEGPSVEMGHRCLEFALPLEFQGIASIFPIEEADDPFTTLPSHLNTATPHRLVDEEGRFRVIHDGDWASYFRRHLFQINYRLNRFMLVSWSVQEAAIEWEEQLRPLLSQLDGYALVAPMLATTETDFRSRMEMVPNTILRNLTTTPSCVWFKYRWPMFGFEADTPLPDQLGWFREVSPPGTAYNANNRIFTEAIDVHDWCPGLAAFAEQDPWNPDLGYHRSRCGVPIDEAFAEISDYSIEALKTLRGKQEKRPDELADTLARMEAMDSEYGLARGELLAALGRPDEAQVAMEHAFQDASDRIGVASKSRWLIHRYRSTGELEKAKEVASHNAEVYSGNGLISAMAFAADEKDRARTQELAEANAERYGDTTYLGIADWAIDGKTNTPAIRRIFPEGIRKSTLDELMDRKEESGLRIMESAPVLHTTPLKVGDVILSIDGVRIDQRPQYFFIMDATLDPDVVFVVLRETDSKPSYHEYQLHLPNRRIGSQVKATR